MSFAEEAPIACSQDDSECAAVFQPQRERLADQRHVGHLEVGRSFDPVKAGNRHAGADQHPLIPRDGVVHPSQDGALIFQITRARELLDELEGRVLHAFILLTIP